MAFDGLFTHSMVSELNKLLLNGRVTKVQHPYTNELILTIRSNKQNYRLLLSAHSVYARCQLTNIPYINPTEPSNFCMTLRKYLDGAFLLKIEQYQNDRIIFYTFSKRDELGDKKELILATELMGKHSNIILFDANTKKIIDCIKHISPSQNSYRTLLPGNLYHMPPAQNDKINPFNYNEEQLFKFLTTTTEFEKQNIQKNIEGFGSDSAMELAYLLNNTKEKSKIFIQFIEKYNNVKPTLAKKNNKWFLLPFPYQTINEKKQFFPTLSELCDDFYGNKAEQDRVNQQIGDILSRLKNEKHKAEQKLPKLEKTLLEADKAEIIRQKGELLTTFLHDVPKGANEVVLHNYYDENKEITIKLDPAYSPSKNAQKYFKKYQKLKKGTHIVKEQIETTKSDINYLNTLIDEIDLASPVEIPDIKEELIQMGFLKEKKKHTRQKKKSVPYKYKSTSGINILVGKNNLQNDELTLKKAKKDYIWLHAKDIPGSHVIIENSNPDETTLLEAANIAAYHSKYRNSANVPVDYVAVKNIHKPNGAKPGFVIFKNQKTLFVTPDEKEIKSLFVE